MSRIPSLEKVRAALEEIGLSGADLTEVCFFSLDFGHITPFLVFAICDEYLLIFFASCACVCVCVCLSTMCMCVCMCLSTPVCVCVRVRE
jgi:hypothetical protein